MSTENEDLSQSLAAELTNTTGMDDVGNDMPDSLANDLAEQEAWQAEKDISVNNDVDDTREAAEQREIEQEQTQQRNKKVPLAALQEERQKRQNLEVQLAAYQQQMQQFQAQQQAAQQQQLQAQQEAEIPDPEIDPIGFIRAKEIQFNQALERLQNPAQQQQESVQVQFQRGVAEVTPVLVESESRAMQQFPDYSEAATFVQQAVAQNIRQQHPDATPEQLQNVQTAALIQFTRQCQAQNIDPASHIYQRAQAMGFKTARQAPRREPPTSLSNLGGSPRAPDETGAVSASDISGMSEAEFDKFWNSMKGSSSQGPAF
ncbi:hypothetical protein [Pseudomonas sp. P9_31]|uniref:hypothetical protein n=1 Tax=Pseudomonas sp. P9_31 TaxID=3043448 RepID=UPI002A3664DF|nr:hypothetical protein [Pseudomonas sp. P9_31]WPN59744.1 hypothetical protein QMK51_09120 [Pseudomonas sp. P9_31]